MLSYYITDHRYRGQGIGSEVYKATFLQLEGMNVGVYGMADKVNMYAKAGFKFPSLGNTRIFSRPTLGVTLEAPPGVQMCEAKDVPFEKLEEYDFHISQMKRKQTLKNKLEMSIACTITLKDGQICGYGCLTSASGGFRLAPLYADDLVCARAITSKLLDKLPTGADIVAFVPDGNQDAVTLFSVFGICMNGQVRSQLMFTKHEVQFPVKNVFSCLNCESVYF